MNGSDQGIDRMLPGLEVQGKAEIKKAFVRIAAYFENSITPTQVNMHMIQAGDTVLVLAQTFLDATNKEESEFRVERTTYVYRNVEGKWLWPSIVHTERHCWISQTVGFLEEIVFEIHIKFR